MSLPAGYFDRMYAADPDPWGFTSRWYEKRKHALTVAALPAARYDRGLEIGCSIGVLTAALAGRCTGLVALDPSAAALSTARGRLPDSVRLIKGSAPHDWPAGTYDLVVLSEVGYYLDAADLERLLDLVDRDLATDGTVVACHWRHPVADNPADRRRGACRPGPLAAGQQDRGRGLPARRARARRRGRRGPARGPVLTACLMRTRCPAVSGGRPCPGSSDGRRCRASDPRRPASAQTC